MVVCIAPSDQRNHHDEALQTLHRLATCDHSDDSVEFCFDVARHQYSALVPGESDGDLTGDLSLSIYNDLKLSEYIAEDDNYTTREIRHFSLTARGREVAASVAH